MTPGPWRLVEQYSPQTGGGVQLPSWAPYIVDARGHNVACVLLGEPIDDEEILANALAIHAVPDLVAALQGIFAQTAKHSRQWGQEAGTYAFARDPDTAKAFAAGRAALAKAGL